MEMLDEQYSSKYNPVRQLFSQTQRNKQKPQKDTESLTSSSKTDTLYLD